MAKRFASLANPGDVINVFDGATGALLYSKSLPSTVSGSAYFDMSFDGLVVAVTAYGQGYVWFWDLQTGAATQIAASGFSAAGHGFDGNGTFYLGGYQQYLKIAAPYTSAITINTAPAALSIYPGQVPEKAIALQRIPDTGATSYVRINLGTGQIGASIGNTAEQGPAIADTQSAYALTWLNSAYGVRQWNYATGDLIGQIGPTSGAVAGDFRSGIGFTSDGQGFVIKTSDTAIGVATLGIASARQVSLDPVADYAADTSYVYVEGLLTDEIALLTSGAARGMLLALNLTTGQVVWQNSNGYNQWLGFGDARACGVQPTLGPGGTPPVTTGFWKDIVMAYETA
jgi:hypothetical protein